MTINVDLMNTGLPWQRRVGVAAVVAPYGTGAHYHAEFHAAGWRCVAVTANDDALPPLYRRTLDRQRYDEVVTHDGNLTATAQALRELAVTAVVAGTEIGVPLADDLAEFLGLPGNSPSTSDRRRDKAAMARALRAVGLDAPDTFETDSLDEALAWARRADHREYVVKPADSAGSDGVAFCREADDIRAAWRCLHDIPNAMGGTNSRLLIQERLVGWQYIVNTVSLGRADGGTRHSVVETWSDVRIGDRLLLDRMDLINPQHRLAQLLAEYTCQALDALDITTGPAHTEIMLTRDRGPVLIETGARPEGMYHPAAVRSATGSDHLRDAASAVITGRPLRSTPDEPRMHASRVVLCAPHDGELTADGVSALLALPTLMGSYGAVRAGAPVRRTKDTITAPGAVFLAHPDRRVLEQDYRAIRAIEANGLYAS